MRKLNLNQKEKAVEAYLVQNTKKLGGRAYKFVSPSQQGVPDRILIFKNIMPIFVEVKTETGIVSRLQKAEIAFLTEMGQDTCVCMGKKGVDELLAIVYAKLQELAAKEKEDAGDSRTS